MSIKLLRGTRNIRNWSVVVHKQTRSDLRKIDEMDNIVHLARYADSIVERRMKGGNENYLQINPLFGCILHG